MINESPKAYAACVADEIISPVETKSNGQSFEGTLFWFAGDFTAFNLENYLKNC
jgi:hypothetical protein